MTEPVYHVPVLLKETVDGLNIQPGGIYVDVTFGGGGHSREILSRLSGSGHLFSFDQDADAEKNVPEGQENFTFVRSNFRYLTNWMRYYDVEHVDGILADLGVSSHHFDDEERGFSFRFEAPLDMRMNERGGMTAADVVNRYDEEALARLFYLYGEMKNSRSLASAIVKKRQTETINTVEQLINVVKPLMGRERVKKDMAKVFQALRIDVNHEFEVLYEFMEKLPGALKPGGRVAILTFHSGEDRLVKQALKEGYREGIYFDYAKDVIRPSAQECAQNGRARSTKMRWAVRAE